MLANRAQHTLPNSLPCVPTAAYLFNPTLNGAGVAIVTEFKFRTMDVSPKVTQLSAQVGGPGYDKDWGDASI